MNWKELPEKFVVITMKSVAVLICMGVWFCLGFGAVIIIIEVLRG